MRMIKLAIYALLGYAIYEFAQGLMHGGSAGGSRRFRDDLHEALNEDEGRRAALTGPGRGTTVLVQDSDGGAHRQKVGRGVISR